MAADQTIAVAEQESPATQSDTGAAASTSEQIASRPEVKEAFARVFGGQDGEARPRETPPAPPAPRVTARVRRQRAEEAADELPPAPEAPGSPAQPEPAETADPATGMDRTQQPPADDAADQEALATLDPVLRRQAQRAGWTDAEIAEAVRLNPNAAVRQFEKLHGSFNDLSRQFATLGQARTQPDAATPGLPWEQPGRTPARPQQQRQTAAEQAMSQLDALFQGGALSEFAQNNGEDIVEKVLKPLYTEVIAPFREMQAYYQAQSQEALRREVNATFKGYESDFAELYGVGGKETPEQREARLEVCRTADQIGFGAAAAGRPIGTAEAIERAHALFTADRQAEIERKRLTSQIQRRSARITARPSQRANPRTVPDGAVKSNDAAIAAVSDWWADHGEA